MRIREFKAAVRSYGVELPRQIHTDHINRWWTQYMGAEATGSGHPRNYTDRNVRITVAHLLWSQLLGRAETVQVNLRREAALAVAYAPHSSWIKIAGDEVLVVKDPTPQDLEGGASLLKVPAWHH
jgi:hypothetical protein